VYRACAEGRLVMEGAMNSAEQTRLEEEIRNLLAEHNWNALRELLQQLAVPEITDLLRSMGSADRAVLFRLLPRALSTAVFAELESPDQNALLQDLTDEETRQLLAAMAPDDRTQLLEELPGRAIQKLLNLLTPADLREARHLLGYPEESVGRLMTPKYVAVRPEWTVARVLEQIRTRGEASETLDVIYVVDRDWKLIDELDVRRFLRARPEQTVAELMDHTFVSLPAIADREEAVQVMQRYDLAVLPVVDSDGVLVGIVTVDDVLDVAQEEATEDFQRLAGVAPVEIDYARAGILLLWRKRIGWLLILLVADFLSSNVIAYYEEAIQAVVALAFFIPMLIDSGGNTGTQAATLIIRGLATGQLDNRDWLRVLGKELAVGLLLGVTLGAVVYVRGFFWRGGPQVGLVVGLTMVALVLWANLIGALLPMLLRKLRMDPAVVSSPFITTAADVTGLLIYFNIAKWVLGI
jgi:magnesium transporter